MLVKITMALFWGAVTGFSAFWVSARSFANGKGTDGCLPVIGISLVAGICGAVLAWNAV